MRSIQSDVAKFSDDADASEAWKCEVDGAIQSAKEAAAKEMKAEAKSSPGKLLERRSSNKSLGGNQDGTDSESSKNARKRRGRARASRVTRKTVSEAGCHDDSLQLVCAGFQFKVPSFGHL